MSALRFLLAGLLLLAARLAEVRAAPPTLVAREEWRSWALRMDKAQRALNYDATLVVDSGNGDWELYEIAQRIGPAGPEQQWVSLNGSGRRQLRTALGVSLLSPEGDQRIGQGPQLRAGPLLAALEASYAISFDPRDRVAGRRALRLSLEPLHRDRYGLRLWIDADTALPLRSERRSADGALLERRMVTRLSVLGFAGTPLPPAGTALAASDWNLPAGFRLVSAALTVPGLAGARHWVLSDGVAWISVYQLQLPQGKIIETGGWRHGALSQLTLRHGEDWYYLLGDVPQELLQRVGETSFEAAR